jgi:hypothetical protein
MLIPKVWETHLSITTVLFPAVNTVSEFLLVKAMSTCSANTEDCSNAPIDFVLFLK